MNDIYNLDDYINHWKKLTPPLAPSEDEVNKYSELINKFSGKVLLLGNTKEIFHLCDNSIDHYPIDNPKCIKGDWFDVANYNQKFNIIIGDGVINLAGKELINVVSQVSNVFIARIFSKKQEGMKYATYFPQPEELPEYSEIFYLTPDCPILVWEFNK